MEEIIIADKTLRKKVIIAIVIFIPIGAYAINRFNSYLHKVLSFSGVDVAVIKIKHMLIGLSVINAIISFGIAIYFISLSMRIFKSKRFPPVGMRVIKDTKVQTGKKAIIMSISLIFIALMVLSTNIGLWYILQIFEKMFLAL